MNLELVKKLFLFLIILSFKNSYSQSKIFIINNDSSNILIVCQLKKDTVYWYAFSKYNKPSYKNIKENDIDIKINNSLYINLLNSLKLQIFKKFDKISFRLYEAMYFEKKFNLMDYKDTCQRIQYSIDSLKVVTYSDFEYQDRYCEKGTFENLEFLYIKDTFIKKADTFFNCHIFKSYYNDCLDHSQRDCVNTIETHYVDKNYLLPIEKSRVYYDKVTRKIRRIRKDTLIEVLNVKEDKSIESILSNNCKSCKKLRYKRPISYYY
jgi:hypothetical protein